ncbi:PREDICTED: uncharacterized protein LOC104819234 [Tarenaya hassleriana]|uniref:uncharacterized protein LOC104819234 n=1 Tax=Tarenaya hassleriana TaxID=28532 RepID=UPI00053C3E80|nr:PREDICTED: uncharacterized protein LOC104819234 [Tarenaya hassleriana]XP_019058734.1 PREDICTED: uncharacterized protein LOC104819234 [Tarenaya hassleriana]
MANHGAGTKYVSVNLNKSYGQQPHHHYNHSGGSGTIRGRAGGYGSGGGGGNMVVLSRPRSAQKAGPKLSVPPPLNLPSLRKEHERIDSLGSSVHSAGGIPGGGSRPASSGMGWSKPAATPASQEKERLDGDVVSGAVELVGKGANGLYMPPVARAGAAEPLESAFPPMEKTATLRGEDFPSLKATLPAASAPGQKQKESLNQKQKQATAEELSKELRGVSVMNSSLVDMRPQLQSAYNRVGLESSESSSFLDESQPPQQLRKKEYFPGPLPLVRLNPRSEWADDERDTSHGFRDWDRDHGYSKNETLWDRDFDVPRPSALPHKPATHNQFDRLGQRENDTGKSSLAQVMPASGAREANTWRTSSQLQNEAGIDRNIGGGAMPSSRGREVIKENKYISSALRDNVWKNTGTRETSYQHGGRQPWNNGMDSSSHRGTFIKDGYRVEHQNRDKRLFFKNDNPQQEDPFIKDFGDTGFDVRDPFPVLGMAKKKKEALKQTDFHDPVRESFEAELERVQKMQEEERRRIIEEQERAMELARRDEEERLRLSREQEEQQRKLEEETREAAWRTEQERLEAARKVEELRKTKEEEKRRIFMEEERRKQAAKQKLLELEERIAKRQAEAAKGCISSSSASGDKSLEIVKEKELPRAVDVVDWEDGERMVERITTSSTLDLPVSTRSFESHSVSHFSRDGSSVFPARQKPSSWRKESIEIGSNTKFISQDMEIVPRSPQRDAGGVFPKKEFFGTAGYMTGRPYFKPGYPEPSIDQSWRIPGDESLYARNGGMESEFRDGFGEHYGDPGWGQGQGHSRHNPYSPYPEKLYQNPEGDNYYPFGRQRFSVKQPRVLPPPMDSMQKLSFRSEVDRPGPSNSVENGGMTYNNASGTEPTAQTSCNGELQDKHEQSGSNRNEHHRFDSKIAGRCESQSSLSVSSPPDSPVHLSHDDLDESGDSSVLAGSRKDKYAALLEKGGEPIMSADAENDSLIIATGSVSCGDDEEWTIDNNEHLQEQEEYDEDEDAYQEEDEMHGGDEMNINLVQEFDKMHLQEKDSNLVLGFNEGVEVEIPNDDFEKCQHNKEAAFTLPQHTVDSVDGERPNETSSSGQDTQTLETPGQVNFDNSSGSFLEIERVMPNLAVQPNSGLQSLQLSESVDKVESLSNSVISAQPGLPSLNVDLHSSTVQTALPLACSAPAQTVEPVKLPFGLFSGPSLIPSPVPAIQIGSIQMPLPLQFGTSLTHMQQSHPPIFQFGQVRYTSPISQGFLPLPHHSIVHPSASSSFALNQNSGAAMTVQLDQSNSSNTLVRNAAIPLSDPQPNVTMRQMNISAGNTLKSANVFPERASNETVMSSQKQGELSGKSGSPSRVSGYGKSNSGVRQSECQAQTGTNAHISVSKDKDTSQLRAHRQAYGAGGKRDAFAVKNYGFRSSGIPEVSRADSGGYRRYRRQRVEFRVRESNRPSLEENVHANGRAPQNSTRNGARKFVVSNKSPKQTLDPDGLGSGSTAPLKSDAGSGSENGSGKDAFIRNQQIPNPGQTNLKRNLLSEEDIDAPLQSGIVRVFEQPGIEAPSDDDDFIEVRSKRQMLNDRREQREKESKAKSQATKASRKLHSAMQNTAAADRFRKIPSVSGTANPKQSNPVTNKQPLAPIGTPALRTDAHADAKSGTSKSSQASAALPVLSRGEQNPVTSFIFNNKNKVLDNIQTSVGPWGNPRSDQVVMALTQSQLDEAMKPISFDSCVSAEDCANSISEPSPSSTSVLLKNNAFPTGTNPINSLLAGEKIQFGAVTSSSVLPPSGRTENDCSLFLEKDKHLNPSSGHMEVCEAEAEAAASAIAVAAITSEEVVGNTMGPGSVSDVETKIFGGAELDGAAGNGEPPSQLKAEESLSVSLPADLSVDTPSISLWPPLLPSPHNSSNQMIGHFPPGPPHYPFYDMNPMLRGPIFAFGPHDESGSSQSQSQIGTGAVSGPPVMWQQGHSSVDSFYAPPAGFTGPFLTPPGGIHGVQTPPHMFVYNQFAPVGQFGQVGLSFMGTTYIPSGKQPDWKHNPVSSAPVAGESDAKNSNVASMQRNPTVVPASVQHLSPGSSLLRMPSPLAMFDVSPFQSSQELPIQAQWPHMPGPALQQTPPSMSLQQQQQAEGPNIPSQYNNLVIPNQPVAPNRYHNSQTSAISDSTVSQLPDELGFAETANSYRSSGPPPLPKGTEANKPSSSNPSGGSGFRPPSRSSQQKNSSSQHFGGSSSGYNNHQRGGSQRGNNDNGSGKEWPHHHHHHHHHHRRSGFHGRNQSVDGEKGFSNAKVKQIYVAKQTVSSSVSVSNTTAATTATTATASS